MAPATTSGTATASPRTSSPASTFDYFLTNPPFGVDWKKQQKEIKQEHDKRGFDGRFGAGLPRVNDGSLLFLQHMVGQARTRAAGGT